MYLGQPCPNKMTYDTVSKVGLPVLASQNILVDSNMHILKYCIDSWQNNRRNDGDATN